MKDIGDDIQAEEKEAIEKAASELEEALKSDDKADIEAKTENLTKASASMAERLYAKQGGQPGADAAAGAAGSGAAGAEGQAQQDDVVDAEFEEVKDDKK